MRCAMTEVRHRAALLELVDRLAHRVFVELEGRKVPVLSLEYEVLAYERLGRRERAELIKRYVARKDGGA